MEDVIRKFRDGVDQKLFSWPEVLCGGDFPQGMLITSLSRSNWWRM
jgi:hypothetical protein